MKHDTDDEVPALAESLADAAFEEEYLKARRGEPPDYVLTVSRRIAEAIAREMVRYIPETERDAYRSTPRLNTQLERLETLSQSGKINVPRYVIAALRTLQAYGNCGVHHKVGDPLPPHRATESALASMAYVTQWYLKKEEREGRNVGLRIPAPTPPGFWEARSLRASLKRGLNTLDDMQGKKFRDSPVKSQLAVLVGYHEHEVAVCEDICRIVLKRETLEDVSDSPLEVLTEYFDALHQQRSERAPKAIAHAMQEVLWRRKSVMKALQSGATDVAPFLAEAERYHPARTIAEWFQAHYLGRGWLARNWGRFLVIGGSLIMVFWFFEACGETAGEKGAYQDMSRVCAHQGDQAVCAEIDRRRRLLEEPPRR